MTGDQRKVMRRGPERRTRKGKKMAEIASRYELQVPTRVEKKRGERKRRIRSYGPARAPVASGDKSENRGERE
jgi:hypothetical protein